jgi:hypothetical protein
MEDVLSYVDQKTKSLHMKLNEKIEKTQIDLEIVELSLNGQNKTLREELTTFKSDFNHMHIEIRAVNLKRLKRLDMNFNFSWNKS